MLYLVMRGKVAFSVPRQDASAKVVVKKRESKLEKPAELAKII